MKLTRQEQQMVDRLRKQERQWRWARWTTLVSGIVTGVVAAYIFYLTTSQFPSDGDSVSSVVILVLSFIACLMFTAIASFQLVQVFTDWHGNTTRVLLLKLIDESTKEPEGDKCASNAGIPPNQTMKIP